MIYLMRHGLDDEDYVGGWSDVSLLEEGRLQVVESALWLKNNLHIERIISSDIKRASESALIVSSFLGKDVIFDRNLREQNKGLLNGLSKDIANSKYSEYMDNVLVDTVYPEGESLRDLYIRIKSYLDRIMKLEDNTLLVTHRGVINMIYYILYNKELDMNKKQFKVDHASVHELDKENRLIRRVK